MALQRNWSGKVGFNPPCLAALFALCATPTFAQDGSLTGREVLFSILTLDNPKEPLFTSTDYGAVVGPGPEFGMVREGTAFGLSSVPVLVDLGTNRLDLSYPGEAPGRFMAARFNGYVLRFPTDCVLITGAAIDPDATTLPLTNDNLIVSPQSLEINVSAHEYDETTRIGVLIDVRDCPIG